MSLDKEQIDYIRRLLESKERTSQPLERLFIDDLRKNLNKMENKQEKRLGRYGGTTTVINELEVGTKFYVYNGAWYGEIILKEGKKCVLVEGLENATEITDDYTLNIKIM